MAKPALDCSTINEAVQTLLPEFIQYDQDIIFLLSQINKNSVLLSRIPLDENSFDQYQIWQKTIEHVAAIKEIVLLRHKKIIMLENTDTPVSNEMELPYQQALIEFVGSNKIEALDNMIKIIEHNTLSQFPAFDFKARVTHCLSNFQGSRITALNRFYKTMEEIMSEADGSADKLKKLQQGIIDLYYQTRKSSVRFELFLSRKSRESSLADTLEKFINEDMLRGRQPGVPHQIKKTDSSPRIEDLLHTEPTPTKK